MVYRKLLKGMENPHLVESVRRISSNMKRKYHIVMDFI